MKELKIGEKIVACRRKYGITQEDLAKYIGVSKTSVSKWETGASYPDITFLPKIASYFNISVDELLGYEPQMTKEQIQNCIRQLSHDFSSQPYETAKKNCADLIQKYPSCFPLLYHIGTLYVSNSGMTQNSQHAEALLTDAIELFQHVIKGTDEIDLKKQARNMEASCLLFLNRPEEALKLLGEPDCSFTSDEPIFASAYRLSGKTQSAKSILQAGMYKNLVVLMNLLVIYLSTVAKDAEKLEETRTRAYALIEAFSLEMLHPAIVFPLYLTLAQCYMKLGDLDNTLKALERYTHLAVSKIHPIKFHGDSYFDLMDLWFNEHLTLGCMMVRSETETKDSIIRSIVDNPIFADLKDDQRFLELVQKLNTLRKDHKK